MLVFIRKGNMDTWGTMLLEVVWKFVEKLIDTRIKKVVQLHDIF